MQHALRGRPTLLQPLWQQDVRGLTDDERASRHGSQLPQLWRRVPHNLKYAKLASCPSCQVALFLEDEVVKHAGERNALADLPVCSLLAFLSPGDTPPTCPMADLLFTAMSAVSGTSGGSSNTGESCWMSVDEGDIAMEQALELTALHRPSIA